MDMQTRKSSWSLSRWRSPAAPADADFMPFSEAFMATPPSPIHMRLMMTICALLAVALVGSWFGHVDIYAVATARIQPTGRSKVIQPLETGRVVAVHVANGATVEAGDMLVELDSTVTAADQVTSSAQLQALKAELARREAAIAAARSQKFSPLPQIALDIGDPVLRGREQAVLQADLSELQSSLNSLDAKLTEVLTQKKSLQATIGAQQNLVATLRKRVDMQESLAERKLGSVASVIDAQQELGEQATVLANQNGDLLRSDAAIESLRKEKEVVVSKFIAVNTQALANGQGRRDELTQRLIKADAQVRYTQLRAPTRGTVQDLAITTIGQVVASGQHLMTLVPENAALEAEALVLNKDIGFVAVNQPAVLKIDAFPFVRYGTLTGRIVRVSHEAVRLGDTQQAEATGTASTQELVYPVTILLDAVTIDVDGRSIRLIPGMSGRVDIRTGERRLLEYFFAPFIEAVAETAHER